MATNSSRLNLTRDQLASFLIDHQQIKQFEMLFSAVDAIAPNVVLEINIAVGTAQATANNAIDQIIALGQSLAVYDAVMSAKVQQALDAIPRLAQALELLASAPVEQPQAAAFDDLRPRAELGTMAAQNADNVRITGGTVAGVTTGAFGTLTASGNTTLGDATTDTTTVNGYMGVGGAADSAVSVYVHPAALSGTGQYGVLSDITGTSAATGSITAVYAKARSVAAAFTVTDVKGLAVIDATKGAGSTITNQYGVDVADQTQGGTNYGIRSRVSSGAGKWNIYAEGTAANFFGGPLSATTIKVTTAAGYISSDGSTGYTGTVTSASLVGKTITIKDGIITAFA